MSKILALSSVDIKNIFREQILYFMFLVFPVLEFLAARFLVPWIGSQYPVIIDYYPLILMMLTLQMVTGIGFVLASILLDERDEAVLTAIQIMPISSISFILYRIGFAVVYSLLFSLIMIQFSGLVNFSWGAAILSSLLFSCLAPIVVLALPIFSSNKVEGLAAFKGINLILLLPLISFFISTPFKAALGIIPVYWSYHFFDKISLGQETWMEFSLALITHFLLLAGLTILFQRRVFNTL